jgi:hypothetical protein
MSYFTTVAVDQSTPGTTNNVTVQQNVNTVASNSSTANLASNATFTGTASSTLGVAGIQVVLKATVASGYCSCTVYIDQSADDGSNWDITDTYDYTSAGQFGITVQAVGTHFRVRVTNLSTTTTTVFRLVSITCPIVEVVPRSLDSDGRLQTSIKGVYDDAGFELQLSPTGQMQVVDPYRLVGEPFGAAIDAAFWTATTSGAGAAAGVAAGIATISSGTANSGYGKISSVRIARFLYAHPLRFSASVRIPTAVVALNTRNWGAVTISGSTPQNGAFFSVSAAGVLSVNTVAGGGAPVSVASGSFNGHVAQWILDTNAHTYQIIYFTSGAFFYVDGIFVHAMRPTTAVLYQTLDTPINVWSVNTGAGVTSGTFECWNATILRLGPAVTAPIVGRITGNAATYNFKAGPGVINKFMFNNTIGTSVTIYDNTSASGPTLAIITTTSAALGVWDIGLPFYTGLTIVTAGNGLDANVLYE